jgi:hypothetical protein
MLNREPKIYHFPTDVNRRNPISTPKGSAGYGGSIHTPSRARNVGK